MALKTVVSAEEFEALDESLQGHYIESQAGGYVLDAEGVDEHPKVLGLRNTLKRFQEVGGTDARRLKAKLEEADRIRESFADLDPDEARAALQRLAELEKGDGDARTITVEQHKDALTKKDTDWTAKLTAKDEEISNLTAYIEEKELDNRLVAGLKGKVLDGTEESVAVWLKSKYENRVVWDTVNGRRAPRPVFVNELGEEVTVDTFAEAWLRSDGAKPFLPGSGNNGTGSKGDSTTNGRHNPWKKETLNLTEQGRIYRENPTLAKQLKAAAGVAA